MSDNETPAVADLYGEVRDAAAGLGVVGRPAPGVGTVVTDVDSVTTRTARRRKYAVRYARLRSAGFDYRTAWQLTDAGYAVLGHIDLTAYSLTPVSSGLVEGAEKQ